MRSLHPLFESNRSWADEVKARDPDFFRTLVGQQSPNYLWIGCADSRVLNCLSVLQYAVDVLDVEHVIVCGHYGCGGVQAALRNSRLGLIDNWLRHVHDVMNKHRARLNELPDEASRLRRLCELNVMEQVLNVGETTIVQSAWDRGKALEVHGWIYDLHDGLLKDLSVCVKSPAEFDEVYRSVLES